MVSSGSGSEQQPSEPAPQAGPPGEAAQPHPPPQQPGTPGQTSPRVRDWAGLPPLPQAQRMVQQQLIPRGVRDERVLEAMRRVPRDMFVPSGMEAWADAAAPAGCGQTVSQPYIVARMSELLRVEPGMSVLELGTGSGYQAAVLAVMGADVYSIERHEQLLNIARDRLEALGLAVHLHHGDGTLGWPDERQFDRILITAAAPDVPERLLNRQLADGGRCVLPVGPRDSQQLAIVEKDQGKLRQIAGEGVRFVPLLGAEGWEQ